MTFEEVDRNYADLRRQYDNGGISAEDFEARMERMRVTDEQGRHWLKDIRGGEWLRYDGSTWIHDSPPTHQRSPVPPPPGRPEPVSPGTPEPDSRSTGQGTKIAVYVLSVLFPIVGFVLFFLYRNRPSRSDRDLGKTAGIIAVVGWIIWIVLVL